MQVLLTVLIFAACVSLGTAQEVLDGRCPDVSPQASLDMDQYAGDWYEQLRTYSGALDLTKCTKKEFAYNEDDKTITLTTSATTDLISVPTTTIKAVQDDDKPALFKIKAEEGGVGGFILGLMPKPSRSFMVVDTDYTSYSVIFQCLNLPFNKYEQYIWIHSRDREGLDADTVNKLKDDLTGMGVDLTSLYDVDQTDCPEESADSSGDTD